MKKLSVIGNVAKVLGIAPGSALLFEQPAYAASIENFDTDPGWMLFNNPANSNDFGFQNSQPITAFGC